MCSAAARAQNAAPSAHNMDARPKLKGDMPCAACYAGTVDTTNCLRSRRSRSRVMQMLTNGVYQVSDVHTPRVAAPQRAVCERGFTAVVASVTALNSVVV